MQKNKNSNKLEKIAKFQKYLYNLILKNHI